jgi:hypothetical protein
LDRPTTLTFAYVSDDPINLVDPLGLQACSGATCPRGDIQVVGERLTIEISPRSTLIVLARIFGTDTGEGLNLGFLRPIISELRSAVCSLPAINLGGGADLYAGGGGSVGGSLNLDFARGRFGISGYTAVGLGVGVDAGPNIGLGPSGGGIVSANVAVSGGFAIPVPGLPGFNIGHSSTYNLVGTDPGYSGGGLGRAGTPLVYGNFGAYRCEYPIVVQFGL